MYQDKKNFVDNIIMVACGYEEKGVRESCATKSRLEGEKLRARRTITKRRGINI